MTARALALLLSTALACATGEDASSSFTTASVPTMPALTSDSDGSTSDPPGTTEAPTTSIPGPTTSPFDPSTTSTGPISSTTSDDTTTTSTSTTQPADTGDDCGPCDAPPGPCFASPGTCIAGECDYAATADGSPCDDGDACTTSDACNGAGSCTGTKLVCTADNATGGACVAGECTGFTCTAPYADCDSDWANGCEVPVGVANQCDINGLNPNGCWTAYCGESNDADATNFGTYHCIDCNNCHKTPENLVQWCNHSTGNWYPPDAGGCGGFLDAVCAP